MKNKDKNQGWDFGSPEEIEEALERNKKIAEEGFDIKEAKEGFDIKEAKEDEPTPIIDPGDDLINLDGTRIGELAGDSYEDRYWAMFDIVKDLIEEIKFLKNKLKEV